MEQCSRILPIMLNLCSTCKALCSSYKVNIIFLLCYLNYKIMSISSLSSSSTVQHLIKIHLCMYINRLNSLCCINNFSQCIFWQKHYHRFTQISQCCQKYVFYTNSVNCAGNFCLLCWQFLPIMLALCSLLMLSYYAQNDAGTYNRLKPIIHSYIYTSHTMPAKCYSTSFSFLALTI